MPPRVAQRRLLHGNPLLLLLAALAVAIPAHGQSSAPAQPTTPAATPAYEVVSVKPSKSSDGMSVRTTEIGFSARNVTLWGLIYNAWDVLPNQPIPGLPSWGDSAQFDVEAKMSEETAAALQKLPGAERSDLRDRMLQALLADRFQLRTHHETKQLPIYALVVTPGGFKSREVPATEPPRGMSWGAGSIEVRASPVASFVHALADTLHRPVVDKTGLTGRYNLALKWAPDDMEPTADAGPSIFTAIQEQLGLKLESTKGPVDVLVVDHAEKPSEN